MLLLDTYLRDYGEDFNVEAGATLFEIGEPVNYVYQIIDGKIKMVRYLRDGHEPVIHSMFTNDIVAESSMFSPCYHCQAQVVVHTRLKRYPKQEVINLLEVSHEFSVAFIKMLATQVRMLRAINEIKSIRSANQRLMAYLILMANKNEEVIIQSSLKDVAGLIGLTHEALYRELKSLESNGKIHRDKHKISILVAYD